MGVFDDIDGDRIARGGGTAGGGSADDDDDDSPTQEEIQNVLEGTQRNINDARQDIQQSRDIIQEADRELADDPINDDGDRNYEKLDRMLGGGGGSSSEMDRSARTGYLDRRYNDD
ncbi:MAG: hypothetical protein SV253_09045, partial [Halobacteria archaeon]|nr:hypothetical protein [Halobacteria archaeon]